MKGLILFGLFAVTSTVCAMPLDFGNVAPASGRFELTIDGVSLGTHGYLEFGSTEADAGSIAVEARDAQTGDLVAAGTFTLQPEGGVVPILCCKAMGNRPRSSSGSTRTFRPRMPATRATRQASLSSRAITSP